MYPNSTASKQALLWLEREAKQRGIHIHHAMCGHGGERWLPREGGKMKRSPVDGYNHETRTVFQYHGCPFHGCPKCYPRYREKMILDNGKTPEQLYQATMNRTAFLRTIGYEVIEAWFCEVGHLKGELPRMETKTYPHAELYDFESYGDKNWKSGRLHRATRHPKSTFHQKKSRWLCTKEFVQWRRIEGVAAFGEKQHKYIHNGTCSKRRTASTFPIRTIPCMPEKIPAAGRKKGLLEGLVRSVRVCLFVGKQIGAHCRPYRLGDSEKMVGLESWRTLCCCLRWRLFSASKVGLLFPCRRLR